MKLPMTFLAIAASLILTACGDGAETKSAENEQKAPPAAITNSNTVKPENQTTSKVADNDKEADDLPVNKISGNSNTGNTRQPKTSKKGADDFDKKVDPEEKDRKNPKDDGKREGGDDDDN